MAWGMEDPAGRAREDSALRHDPAWDRPRRRRPREGLLVILFIVLAAAAIWFTLQHEDDAAADADRAAAVARGAVGLSGPSPARPANLTPVIAGMRAQAGAGDTVTALRVAPTQVSATMVGGDGRPSPDAPGAAGTGAIPRTVGNIVACVEAAGTDGAAIARCLR